MRYSDKDFTIVYSYETADCIEKSDFDSCDVYYKDNFLASFRNRPYGYQNQDLTFAYIQGYGDALNLNLSEYLNFVTEKDRIINYN